MLWLYSVKKCYIENQKHRKTSDWLGYKINHEDAEQYIFKGEDITHECFFSSKGRVWLIDWFDLRSEILKSIRISASAGAEAAVAAELTKKCKFCKMSKQVLSFPSAHAHLPDGCRLCRAENTTLSENIGLYQRLFQPILNCFSETIGACPLLSFCSCHDNLYKMAITLINAPKEETKSKWTSRINSLFHFCTKKTKRRWQVKKRKARGFFSFAIGMQCWGRW